MEDVKIELETWSMLVRKARIAYKNEQGPFHLNKSVMANTFISIVSDILNQVYSFIDECCEPVSSNQDFTFLNKSYKLRKISIAFQDLFDSFEEDYEATSLLEIKEEPVKEELIVEPKIKGYVISNKKEFKCDKCGKTWAYRKGLTYHKSKGKCSQEPRWIKWTRGRPLCIHPDCQGGDTAYTYTALMKHIMDVHSTPANSVLECNECPQKFPMAVVLKHHQEMVHQAHAKICTICGKLVSDMRKHRLVHTGEKPFQCDKCDFRCGRSSTLKRHMYTHSTDGSEGRNHKCDLCDKAFYEAHVLKEHKLTHDKIKPYQCKLCPDVFSNYSGHRQHMMRAHGQKLTCPICGKDSYSMRGLNIHKRDTHGIPI